MRGPLYPDVSPGMDVGGFTVEGLLGSGGCGAVYRARRGGTASALKLQSLAALGGWARREVAILTRLSHPNVVRFRACGLWPDEAPEWFYIAMELVEGRTLNAWVAEENPSARRAASLMRGLARGLAAAHAEGVLHRDVKEANVVVREATGEAVLVDFGVGSYPGAPRLTRAVLPPGTPQYRSPEALAFRREHWSEAGAHYTFTQTDDLYALGVVFYWVLTDRHPFPAPSTPTEVDAVISRPPMAPHLANPRVPPALSAVCLRLLEKQPRARFPSAGALAAALESSLSEADDTWEVPLCESKESAPSVLPLDAADEEAAWLLHGEDAGGPPRRGRPPMEPRTTPGVAPPSGPSMPELKSAPSSTCGSRRRRNAVVPWLLAVLIVGLALMLVWRTAPREEPGREVAPAAGALEAVQAAAAPRPAASIPAAVAPTAAHRPKEAPPVNPPVTPPVVPAPSRPVRNAGSLSRAATAAAACIALGCPGGPQVRPAPPAEPCPAGAVKVMKQLGIGLGARGSAAFGGDSDNFPTVRDGWVRIPWVGRGLGKLKYGSVSGRLIVGERVYGRFTEAQLDDGEERFPVCLEMYDSEDGKRGVKREPGSTDPDSARILGNVRLLAVDHFE